MIAERSNASCEFRGIRYDHSRVAVRAQIFCGIETDARGVSERAGAPAFVGRANGLGVVFDHWQLVRFRKGQDGIHVGGEAIEMYDHDGARPRRDAAFEFGRINIVSVRANVRENGLCSKGANSAARGDESERRQEYFVSGADAARAQS